MGEVSLLVCFILLLECVHDVKSEVGLYSHDIEDLAQSIQLRMNPTKDEKIKLSFIVQLTN